MNELIEKLSKEANAWYPMGYPSGEGGDAAWQNLVIFEREDLEKFAELIVRECSKFADSKLAFDDDSGECLIWVDGSDLLKHFGVEE